MARLKELVEEVVEATKLCPDTLQPLAFEILLNYQLKIHSPGAASSRPIPPKSDDRMTEDPSTGAPPEDLEDSNEEDISLKDLHAKTRKFMQDSNLSLQEVNALYYKEGDDIKPLYDDLRSTGMSESQIRLALLEAFEHSFLTGDFEFRGESVREKCRLHKCYDSPNFTRNFKSNTNLSDGFEKYEAATPIRLSPAGKQRLGNLLGELARSP